MKFPLFGSTVLLRICGLMLAGMVFPDIARAAPRIAVDESHFNFGEQSNTQTIEHTFIVRNTGDAVLEIAQIRSSCGCTVGNVSSRRVEPGGTSEITALYDLRGRQGRQHSVLTLETNDPRQPQTRLTMGGYAVRELTVRPSQVVFGQVVPGHRSIRHLEVEGLPTQPFEITSVRIGSEDFAVVDQEELSSHHYRFTLVVLSEGAAGHRQSSLQIQTSHPQFPVLQVPVSAELAGALAVAPHSITLVAGNMQPVTRYIVVRPGAVRTFAIHEVIAPSEDIRVSVMPLPNHGFRIQLSNVMASGELEGKSIRILTDVEGMEEIEVPFEILRPAS